MEFTDNTRGFGMGGGIDNHYTWNIEKNWSIRMNISKIIKEFESEYKVMQGHVASYLKDSTISVEDKLVLLDSTSVSIIMSDTPNVRFNGKEISWYDDFCVERYQTVSISELIHSALDDNREGAAEFANDLLELGITHFTYDW